MYQFILSELQFRALQSWQSTATHIVVFAVLVMTIRVWRAHMLRKRTPTFDVVTSEATTLNLSEALS
jgi:hypothetical protein